jgi:hypothetical protein
MKKLTLIGILSILLYGCTFVEINNPATIYKILCYENGKADYYFSKGPNDYNTICFHDSCGKFNIGDTIIIKAK